MSGGWGGAVWAKLDCVRIIVPIYRLYDLFFNLGLYGPRDVVEGLEC